MLSQWRRLYGPGNPTLSICRHQQRLHFVIQNQCIPWFLQCTAAPYRLTHRLPTIKLFPPPPTTTLTTLLRGPTLVENQIINFSVLDVHITGARIGFYKHHLANLQARLSPGSLHLKILFFTFFPQDKSMFFGLFLEAELTRLDGLFKFYFPAFTTIELQHRLGSILQW